MNFWVNFVAAFALALPPTAVDTPAATSGLAGATILIVRHAEKPDTGRGLAPAGEQRAVAYARYFADFPLTGKHFRPDYLISSSDSKSSERPRLTIEPLSKALHIPIDHRFADREFAQLAADLRAHPHGKAILIAWHHGEIPSLIGALGADPAAILPAPKWPDDQFGWVVALHYNRSGIPTRYALIREHLMPDDGPE